MDGFKSRPTITITTYSASKSYFKQSIERQHLQEQKNSNTGATRSDFSTNFFRNIKTSGSPHGQTKTTPRNRVLSDLSQIKGPTGSVRGHKDVVRRSLEGIKIAYHNRYNYSSSSLSAASLLSFSTFFANKMAAKEGDGNLHSSLNQTTSSCNIATNANSSLLMFGNELYCSEYLEGIVEEEQNLCVAYTTTLGVIRRTFEDSKILKYEERDIYLNQEYKFQLRMRTGGLMIVPALFVDGQYIGSTSEVETMNENGELQVLLAKFKMSKAPSEICFCCGNARFIACQSCNGSRKSTIHHFKFNSIALRCIKCDKNDGLVQCPVCSTRTLCEQLEVDEEAERKEAKKVDEKVHGDAIKLVESQNKAEVDINNN